MEKTLTDLVGLYDEWVVHKRNLESKISAQLAEANAQIEQIEKAIQEALPPGITSMSFPGVASGDKISVGLKTTTSYVPETGKSDDFYKWVAENGRIDMLSRSIKKSAVEAEIASTGKFPPFIQSMTDTKLSITRLKAAPTGV